MVTRKKINFISKLCTFLLLFTLFFDGIAFTQDVNAAATPKLNKKKVSVKEGKEVSVEQISKSYKAGWRITDAKVKNSEVANAKVKKNKKVVVVTGVQEGNTKVVVKLKNVKSGASKKLKFKVKVKVSGTITLDETDVTLRVNESMVIYATVTSDNTTNKTVTWESSNTDIVIVEKGKIIAKVPGEATITATAVGKTATCKVTVVDKIAVESIELNQKELKLKPGDKITLNISEKTPWNATIDKISWKSSDSEIVSVKYGEVTAKKTGTATITATVDGKNAICQVTVVKEIGLEKLNLQPTAISIGVGETRELDKVFNLIFTPWNASIESIEWEISYSKDNEGTIKIENGKLIALKPGQVTLTVCVDGSDGRGGSKSKKRSCSVKVNKSVPKKRNEPSPTYYPVESIVLDKNTIDLEVGDTGFLYAYITPSDASNQGILWVSRDENIAEVTQEGVINAKSEGTTTITAMVDGKSAMCEVNVKSANPSDPVVISVTGLTLSNTSLEIAVGGKSTLTATVAPDDATDKSVTWSSGNSAVATVSENGEVSAISVGTTVITAKAGENEASCSITVNPIAVTGITLSSDDLLLKKEGESGKLSLNLKVGDAGKLIASVTPDNATDKSVTWNSNNLAVATVSESGEITAVSVGTAVITAQAGDVAAFCTITINPIAVTGINLSQSSLNLKVGESRTLTATVTPDNATDKTVTWTSSDERVAVVSGGAITAIAAGNAIVTANAGDKTAECTVTVTKIEAQAPQITNENTLPQNIRFDGDWGFSVDNGDINYTGSDVGYSIKVNANVEDGGTLSYQWYLADSSEGVGSKIDNEISDTITIKGGSVFDLKSSVDSYIKYLYVVITNTKDGETKETVSQRITIDYKKFNFIYSQNV